MNKYKLNDILIEIIPSEIVKNNNLLVNDYKELEIVLKFLEKKIKFCYFCKEKVNQIIYDEETNIYIEDLPGLSDCFYSVLLITENTTYINYTYNFDLIKKLFYENEKEKSIIKKVLNSINLQHLIHNYEGFDISENDMINNEIATIKQKNEDNIKNNLNFFKEYDIDLKEDDIIDTNIEIIYINIINSLIKNRKFEDYKHTLDVIKELDLENIDITQNMYNSLLDLLNSHESYVDDYIISTLEDLCDEKKINFYYILIKYILKNSIYIYNIPLLINTRRNFIKIIKEESDEIKSFIFDNNIYNILNEKRKYLLKKIIDSEYYYVKYLNNKIAQLKIVLKYYKQFLFESKKDNIDEIEEYIKTGIKNEELEENNLKEIDIAIFYSDRFEIINYFYNIKEKSESGIKKILSSWNKLEKSIKEKKISKLPKNIMEKIYNYFNDENKNSIIKIFNKEIYDFIIQIKHNQENYEKLKEICKYYRNYFPESKKDNITEIGEIIKKKTSFETFQNYLDEYDIALKMNKRASIIEHILEFENKGMPKTERAINNATKSFENFEKLIIENKIEDIPEDYRKILINYFKNNKDIFDEEIINKFIEAADIQKISNNKKHQEFEPIQNEKIFNEKQNNINLNNIKNSVVDNKLNKQNNNYFSQSFIPSTMTFTRDIKNVGTNNNKEIIIVDDKELRYSIYIINKIFNQSEFYYNVNKKKELVLNKIKFRDNTSLTTKKYNDIKNYCEKCDEIIKKEELIYNYNLFNKYLDEAQNLINNEFIYEYNLKIKMEIINNNNNNINEDNINIYNISVIYKFCPPNSNEEIQYKDDNILIHTTNSYSEGIQCLIEEINDPKYENIKHIDNNEKSSRNQNIQVSISNDNNKNEIFEHTLMINKGNNKPFKADKITILEFIKIIGNHKMKKGICCALFIKELSNGYFISGGTDNILKIYDCNGELDKDIGEISAIKEWTYNVTERMNFDKISNDLIQIITCSNKELHLLEINFKEKRIKDEKYELPNSTCINCIEMKNNDFALIGLNVSFYFTDLFKNDYRKADNYIIIEKTYRNGIKINDNILALTSNKVAVDGEDSLIFYDERKKSWKRERRIIYRIDNYSFNLNTNGLALMYCDNDNKYRIMLCACKKYLGGQKNGILLVNPQLEENHEVNNPFYDTGDFEVYCFCPIFDFFYKKEKISDEKIKSKNTELFFVGGYDNSKNQGEIKLYRLICNEKTYNVKIEYLQDITIKNNNFGRFGGAVNCIIQSQKTGIILVTCNDGKIYKFSVPNIDFYKENI